MGSAMKLSDAKRISQTWAGGRLVRTLFEVGDLHLSIKYGVNGGASHSAGVWLCDDMFWLSDADAEEFYHRAISSFQEFKR